MRILCHTQHLSGVGHFVRMHALACGLCPGNEVHLLAGGRPVPRAPDPVDLRIVSLPPLARSGGALIALDGTPIASVLAARVAVLVRAVEQIRPHVVLVDHYPFSKWELDAEITAAIDAARRCDPAVRVLCSLRDVVRQTRYETIEPDAYYARVLARLRARFDAILVHADPRFTRIADHFRRAADLPVPVVYSGFVLPPTAPAAAPPAPRPYAVLSCGGGSGALPFLLAAIQAFRLVAEANGARAMDLVVFTGSFAPPADRAALAAAAGRSAMRIHPFGPEFAAALAGSALSISRAGYNTCAALLRSRTRAVLAPDPVMSDQTYRAQRFAELGLTRMVEGDPPAVEALVAAIGAALTGPAPRHELALDGVARTRELLAHWSGTTASRRPS